MVDAQRFQKPVRAQAGKNRKDCIARTQFSVAYTNTRSPSITQGPFFGHGGHKGNTKSTENIVYKKTLREVLHGQIDLFLLNLATTSTTCWCWRLEGLSSINFLSSLGARLIAVSSCNMPSLVLRMARSIDAL